MSNYLCKLTELEFKWKKEGKKKEQSIFQEGDRRRRTNFSLSVYAQHVSPRVWSTSPFSALSHHLGFWLLDFFSCLWASDVNFRIVRKKKKNPQVSFPIFWKLTAPGIVFILSTYIGVWDCRGVMLPSPNLQHTHTTNWVAWMVKVRRIFNYHVFFFFLSKCLFVSIEGKGAFLLGEKYY